jgi:hypothetical protein
MYGTTRGLIATVRHPHKARRCGGVHRPVEF